MDMPGACFADSGTRAALGAARRHVGCVILRLPGLARTFPVDQIDPIRCNQLAFMDLFQISLHNGRFLLIPREAFSDAAPFAAIDALIAKSAPISPEQDDMDAVVADGSGPSAAGPRGETPC
jgi:hypothetical protein